jgi:hypothetical protein
VSQSTAACQDRSGTAKIESRKYISQVTFCTNIATM